MRQGVSRRRHLRNNIREVSLMQTITYAGTDVSISELCLGTMMFGDRCDQSESDRNLSNEFATARGLHPAQLAVAWVRKTPGVTSPISGVSSLRQLQASIDAMEVTLSDAEYHEIAAMFDAAVKEEAGGNYANLRRATDLIAIDTE
jgi:aryl-alcohol dehydrogenase-like predicted oxidoreductase